MLEDIQDTTIMVSFLVLGTVIWALVNADCGIQEIFDATVGDCKACGDSCYTCFAPKTSTSDNCLTCSYLDDVLTGGYCVHKCNATRTCSNCSMNCELCGQFEKDQCGRCKTGLFLDGVKCGKTCSAGKYRDNSNRLCVPCDPACATCSGAGASKCIQCAASYYRAVDGCYKPVCGDGHVVATEECDDAINAPGSSCVACKLSTPCAVPSLKSAVFDGDSSAITIVYSEKIGSRGNNCDMFVDSASLGQDAECTIDGKTLTVRLGQWPSLHFPLYLRVQQDTLMGFTCPFLDSLQIPVVSPPLPPYQVTVIGPREISTCDYEADFEVVAAGSAAIEGIAQCEWRFYRLQSSGKALVEVLSTSSDTRAIAVRTDSVIRSAGDYTCVVTCGSSSGKAAEAQWSFTTFERGKVRVLPFGVWNLTVSERTQLTFRAEVEVNKTCLEVHGEVEVGVAWSLTSSSPRASELSAYVELHSPNFILALPSYFLRPLESVRIIATAVLPAFPSASGSNELTVTCERGTLFPVLDRYQIAVTAQDEVRIDAGMSYRAGESPNALVYKWLCYSGTGADPVPNDSRSLLVLPAGTLLLGRHHCQVSLSDQYGTEEATAIVDVLPQSAELPVLQSAYSELVSSHASRYWLWNSPNFPITSAEVSPSSSAEVSISPGLGFVSVTRKDTLAGRVWLTVNTERAQLLREIEAAAQPYGGSLTVTPDQGQAYLTLFHFSANRWSQSSTKYQFLYYSIEGLWVPLTDFLYTSEILLRLPPGAAKDSLLRVAVKVCTHQEVCGWQEALVRSTQLANTLSTPVDAANEVLRSTAPRAEEILRAVLVLSSLIPNDPETSDPTACLCFNSGHCVDGHCVCAEEWTGRYCQTLFAEDKGYAAVARTLTSRLQAVLYSLPPTVGLFENTLRSVWALYQKSEYSDATFDSQLISFLMSKQPFSSTEWLYTDISLSSTPLSAPASEVVAKIALTSYGRLAGNSTLAGLPALALARLQLLRTALLSIAPRRESFGLKGTCGLVRTAALPPQFQSATVSFSDDSVAEVTVGLPDASQPYALVVIETWEEQLEWRNSNTRLTPVVETAVIGLWNATETVGKWLTLRFTVSVGNDTAPECVRWTDTLWSAEACTTLWLNSTALACNCSRGTVFTVQSSASSPIETSEVPSESVHGAQAKYWLQWVPIATFSSLCLLCTGAMLWGRWRDRKDSENQAKSSVVSQQNGSSADLVIVSGDNIVSDPRTPDSTTSALSFLTALKLCHYAVSIVCRCDESISRASRAWLYLFRLATMSAMLLQGRSLPQWLPLEYARTALVAVCVEVSVYTTASLLQRLMKTYPDDNLQAVSVNPAVNVVEVLKHSPQIKLFESRREVEAQRITPFPDAALKQPSLPLSPAQRCRFLAGLGLTTALVGVAGLVHFRAHGDISQWSVAFPALAFLDFAVVQTAAVAVQVAVINRKGACALLSRALREAM